MPMQNCRSPQQLTFFANPMAVTKLELFSDYSREGVHAIFSPETPFTPQAGTWGLHGIVNIPDREKDYVFFVTFGQRQGKHRFYEFVTDEGVLSWQSQPQQGFDDKRIANFISHKEDISNIYLFLRTKGRQPYTYLGLLKYLDHDPTKQRPVFFQWQILDWPSGANVLSKIGLATTPASSSPGPGLPLANVEMVPGALTFTEVPPGRARGSLRTMKTIRPRRPDYVKNQYENQRLGLLGEQLVVRYEIDRLTASGHPELASKVRHVSVLENDTAGYDVLSFDNNSARRFIEVKTTRGSADADFFLSANELAFASDHSSEYFLYRIYDYVDPTDTAKCFIIAGDPKINVALELVPMAYRVAMYDK